MSGKTGRNDPCGCGSGKKYKDCCGTPKGEVTTVRVKDIKDFELTPGLAIALTESLDASYLEYYGAACSGRSTKESQRRIAAIPEDKRYLTRVLDSLDKLNSDLKRVTDYQYLWQIQGSLVPVYIISKFPGVEAKPRT